MSEIKITELLKQLHGALENARTLSDEDRDMLRKLSSDIQGLLAHGGATGAGPRSTLALLEDAVVRFEVTHPEITATLASVSKALGDMGI